MDRVSEADGEVGAMSERAAEAEVRPVMIAIPVSR